MFLLIVFVRAYVVCVYVGTNICVLYLDLLPLHQWVTKRPETGFGRYAGACSCCADVGRCFDPVWDNFFVGGGVGAVVVAVAVNVAALVAVVAAVDVGCSSG